MVLHIGQRQSASEDTVGDGTRCSEAPSEQSEEAIEARITRAK